MLITTYKVTAPNVIEEFVEDISVSKGQALVKVDTLAICKADIRYFLGLRSKAVLDHKYPLTPIHEAVGYIVKDYTGCFKKGDKVILVPNYVDKSKCVDCIHERCKEEALGENYCPYATFLSSTKDGFLKPFFAGNEKNLVKIDDSIPMNIAVWSELLSVGLAGCRRLGIKPHQKLAIFGDGIMAYLVYLVLIYMYEADVTVYGIDEDKMKCFKKAKTTTFSRGNKLYFDTLIECVGGKYAPDAINNMIDIATIGADLLLMGVTEDLAGINTRKVLEKGLCIKGVTRSSYNDFVKVSKLLENKELQSDLKDIVLSETTINNISDIYHTYEKEISNTKVIGKNLLRF